MVTAYYASSMSETTPDPETLEEEPSDSTPLNHPHLNWLRRTAQAMSDDYQKMFAQVGEDKRRVQESGHKAEAAWRGLLQAWLPPTYEVGSRKYIIGEVETDDPPFETDLVIFRPSYPKPLRDETEVLASGVAAAFSVKSTIRSQSIAEAAASCAKIQRTLAQRSGSMRKELVRPFPYGLLSHSHDWKKPESAPADNISKELFKRDHEFAQHPRESIDLICVPDVGVWSKMTLFLHPQTATNWGEDAADLAAKFSRPQLHTVHVHSPIKNDEGHAIAVFLTSLYSILVAGDPTFAELARGFGHMGGSADGRGPRREWDPASVLTEPVLNDALTGGTRDPNSENGYWFGYSAPYLV